MDRSSEGFFLTSPSRDLEYRMIRNTPHEAAREVRASVRAMWLRCGPYLEPDFREQASVDWPARFWEMYLTYALLTHGVSLVTRSERESPRGGPDILVTGRPRLWIEAKTAMPGTGEDRVREPELNKVFEVPDAGIKLRLIAAVEEKLAQGIRWRDSGLISTSDSFVIAINGGHIPLGRKELDLPRIVRVLFPFGWPVAHLDATNKIVGETWSHLPAERKRSGKEVPTTLFEEDRSSLISAVIYSGSNVFNHPGPPYRAGDEFVIVHNPKAANPIKADHLPYMQEWWAEDGKIRGRKAAAEARQRQKTGSWDHT